MKPRLMSRPTQMRSLLPSPVLAPMLAMAMALTLVSTLALLCGGFAIKASFAQDGLKPLSDGPLSAAQASDVSVFASQASASHMLSEQELDRLEKLPWRRHLRDTAPESEISVESLRFSAEQALKRWQDVTTAPSTTDYQAYFAIFREVARLESLARAFDLVDISLNPDLDAALTAALSQLDQAGLTADRAGKQALRALIDGDDALFAPEEIEGVKITSALILDYLTGFEAAKLAISLAQRLLAADWADLAIALYADFVPDFFKEVTTAQDRLSLIEFAADQARFLADPAIITAFSEIIANAPLDEKVALSQAIFHRLDPDFISDQIAASKLPFTQILAQAWLHGHQRATGATPTKSLSDLLQAANAASNYVAFEILFASLTEKQMRDDFVVAAVEADLAAERPLRAFHKLNNLPVSADVRTSLSVALLRQFADKDYALYVQEIARQLVADHAAGSSVLSDAVLRQLASSIDIVADEAFHADVAQAFQGLPRYADLFAGAHLRAQIRQLFNLPIDQSVNALEIDASRALDSHLSVAAALITGADIPPFSEVQSRPEDRDLLRQVAKVLWSYRDRRDLLADFLSSDFNSQLRGLVALGVTGHPAFDASRHAGRKIAQAIAALLPVINDPAIAQNLAAAIGQIDIENVGSNPIARGGSQTLDAVISDEPSPLLARYARYKAAHGEAVEESLIASKEDRLAAAEAWAVFHGLDAVTDEIAAKPDYLARVTAFHRLATARADILDSEGWLNSADPSATMAPVLPSFQQSQSMSDQPLTIKPAVKGALEATGRPFMPNLLLGPQAVTGRIPVLTRRDFFGLTAVAAKRGETRGTRLVRYASEHFDGIVNLGVRDYIYLNNQTSTPRLIYLAQGTATLSEVVSQVSLKDPSAISYEDGIVTLHVPMEISAGATLIVSGLDIKELRLDTKAGAFLVNSGTLYTDRVVISSYDSDTQQPSFVEDGGQTPKFRPFIVSWSDSETYASSSHFLALGYSGGRTYGLSLSAGPLDTLYKRLDAAPPTGLLINNSLENLYYGFYTHGAEDVVVVGNELRNGVIYGLDPHDWSYNLMMAYNTAYKTQKKHGIIISREVDDSYILGNLSFQNAGSGIMLDRLSYGTVIFANDASRNRGDGFASMESPCALVHSNYFGDNRRTGIKIRNAWDVHLENNAVADNGAAGIEAYIDNLTVAADSAFRNFDKDPFFPIATMTAIGNEVRNNGVGVSVRGASEALFFQNKFVNQIPKYAAGDIKELALDIVSKSMTTGLRVSSRCIPRIPIKKSCSLFDQGVIFSQASQSDYHGDQAASNFCVDVANSPQANSFNPAAVE